MRKRGYQGPCGGAQSMGNVVGTEVVCLNRQPGSDPGPFGTIHANAPTDFRHFVPGRLVRAWMSGRSDAWLRRWKPPDQNDGFGAWFGRPDRERRPCAARILRSVGQWGSLRFEHP